MADDEHPVASARLLRRALEYASAFDIPVVDWCQERDYTFIPCFMDSNLDFHEIPFPNGKGQVREVTNYFFAYSAASALKPYMDLSDVS